jgi:hypothetical protein
LLALDSQQTTIYNVHGVVFDPALVAHPDWDTIEELHDYDAERPDVDQGTVISE